MHALNEYGSMPQALAEPERWAHLCGHHGAGYFAEDDLRSMSRAGRVPDGCG